MRYMITPDEKQHFPIRVIRKVVLGVTQKQFAEIAGASQTAVSRWEDGCQVPSLDELAKIRKFAVDAGKPWDDSWFFEQPDLSKGKRSKRRGTQ